MSTKIILKPYKKKEVRAMYEMNYKAFKTLIDKHKDAIGECPGQYYDVNQLLIIFSKLGIPSAYLSDELEKITFEMKKIA